MADRVIFQTNDTITEDHIQEWIGRANLGDYVEDGLTFTADFTNVVLDISNGKAHILENSGHGQDITALPDARTDLALTDSATNYVFLAVNTANNDDIYYHIDTDKTAPSDPSLFIGTVDTANNTTTETNRFPDVTNYQTQNRKYPTINVDAHGAVGDGSTDDTQSIRDAIAEASASNPSALEFSAGKTYLLTGNVDIPAKDIRAVYGNNAWIKWDSSATTDSTIFSVNGNMTNTASPASGNNQTLAREEFKTLITDLQIYDVQDQYGGVAIWVADTFGTTITNCHIFGTSNAINLTGDHRNIEIYGNNIWNVGQRGIYCNANIHQCLVENNHISYFNKGIYLNMGTVANFHVIGNDIEDSTSGGAGASTHLIYATGTGLGESIIANNTIQDHNSATTAHIELENAGDQTLISDNYISHGDVPAIILDGTDHVTIRDNRFQDYTANVIEMQYGAGNTADGITIRDNDFIGISGAWATYSNSDAKHTNFSWSGNSIENGGEGLHLSTHEINGFDISNNYVTDIEGNLITVLANSNFLIDGNVSNNTAHTAGTASANYGMQIEKTHSGSKLFNVQINGNMYRGRSDVDNGIRVNAGESGDSDGVIVANNVVRHSGVGSAFDLPASGTTDVVIKDNIDSS